MITKHLVTGLLAASLITAAASAQAGGNRRHGYNGEHSDWAKVTAVEPIYRTVRVSTPQRECWTEEVRHPSSQQVRGDSAGNTILGGLIGGVIGHQVGRHINRGRGKHAATVAGAVIGAAIGHDKASQRTRHYGGSEVSYQEHCQTQQVSHQEQRLDGYQVSYRYQGQHYSTQMADHPGKRIRVNVQVTPVTD